MLYGHLRFFQEVSQCFFCSIVFIDFFQLSVGYILKKKYLVAVAKQFILRIVVDWFSQKVDLVINELLYSVACAEFFLGGGIFEKIFKILPTFSFRSNNF